MPVLTLPHRHETKVYVSEDGYVAITQEDLADQGVQSVVNIHHTDIPAVVQALDIAAREAAKKEPL
ncbi:hypothetical protein KL86DPRO_11607 [uncultured delta proteobacterium]|uniref:Uncharacterized protein n=1 Tax=uncultured delta proteobacterium TaxID=34034 RepID=A0A212JJ99_9DELT|nr:hypothetical protein KL86DPRO_11607 [uncultured delta proteobacterium]